MATRTSISVPADLKRRMESLGVEVNWSAVACEAFRRKCRQVETGDPGPIPPQFKEYAEVVIRLLTEAVADMG